MPKDKIGLLFLCLFAGIIVNIGTRGLGYVAHLVVPGLGFGFVLWVAIMIVLAVRGR